MRGKIKWQTPLRQYEFIAGEFEFDCIDSYNNAVDSAVSACNKLNHMPMGKPLTVKKALKPVDPADEIQTISGVDWRKRKTGWQYYDKTVSKWVTSAEPPQK